MVFPNDFYAFIEEYTGKLLRYWVYKKPGVSYNYGDGEEVGPYESKTCLYGRITKAYVLPDNDFLLCFEDEGIGGTAYQEFYKLSEVRIAFTEYDQEDE